MRNWQLVLHIGCSRGPTTSAGLMVTRVLWSQRPARSAVRIRAPSRHLFCDRCYWIPVLHIYKVLRLKLEKDLHFVFSQKKKTNSGHLLPIRQLPRRSCRIRIWPTALIFILSLCQFFGLILIVTMDETTLSGLEYIFATSNSISRCAIACSMIHQSGIL